MAEHYMTLDRETLDKPEFSRIARELSISRGDAVLGVLRVWFWFDEHSTTGLVEGIGPEEIDRITGHTGFGNAMVKAGWLAVSTDGISQPRFDFHRLAPSYKEIKHRTRAAKSRDKSALAVQTWRLASDDERKTLARLPMFAKFAKDAAGAASEPEQIEGAAPSDSDGKSPEKLVADQGARIVRDQRTEKEKEKETGNGEEKKSKTGPARDARAAGPGRKIGSSKTGSGGLLRSITSADLRSVRKLAALYARLPAEDPGAIPPGERDDSWLLWLALARKCVAEGKQPERLFCRLAGRGEWDRIADEYLESARKTMAGIARQQKEESERVARRNRPKNKVSAATKAKTKQHLQNLKNKQKAG